MSVNKAGWLCNSLLSHFWFSTDALPKQTQMHCCREEVVAPLSPVSSTDCGADQTRVLGCLFSSHLSCKILLCPCHCIKLLHALIHEYRKTSHYLFGYCLNLMAWGRREPSCAAW